MKQITSLGLANEVIAKLVNLIEYEYGFAKYAHHVYARNCANFDDENERQQYLLWSGGQAEAMERVKTKTDEIFEDIFNNMIKGGS